MNPPSEAAYSLEIVARLSGLDAGTILSYVKQGLLHASPGTDEDESFDDETLRTLGQIEYLRHACGVNEDGLKLILNLMAEMERLRDELRRRR
jgi:MerR family transcriptional regulator/heat shock protein HspR